MPLTDNLLDVQDYEATIDAKGVVRLTVDELDIREVLLGPVFSPVACDSTSSSSSCTSSSS